ncbi:unnamed protein product [Dovyalis caffra]|uniref:Uncharacterized protein n=1 Tax=Dovyalis caffra TaxID=77055 RepID=A0AAV1SSW7_9ROSI|nr:unnamed protein product [Dovyalis caffra]
MDCLEGSMTQMGLPGWQESSQGMNNNCRLASPGSAVGWQDTQTLSLTTSGLVSAGIEPLARNVSAVPEAATTGVERATFSEQYLRLERISIEKEPFGLKNDQPCCCQRKERFAESVALNHQESQLLRRRKMTLMAIPSVGKQMGCHSNQQRLL